MLSVLGVTLRVDVAVTGRTNVTLSVCDGEADWLGICVALAVLESDEVLACEGLLEDVGVPDREGVIT